MVLVLFHLLANTPNGKVVTVNSVKQSSQEGTKRRDDFSLWIGLPLGTGRTLVPAP